MFDGRMQPAKWIEQMIAHADNSAPDLQRAIAELQCGVILMHARGRPYEWKSLPRLTPEEVLPLPEEHDAQDGHAMIATTPDPESVSISLDHERTLERLMSELPEEHREVLILREIEDMNYRDIAMITNVPIGTVMSRLARARAALKTRWVTLEGAAPRDVR